MHDGQETHCLVLSEFSSHKEILCLVGILDEYPMTGELWVRIRNGAKKEVVAVSSKEAMWFKKKKICIYISTITLCQVLG